MSVAFPATAVRLRARTLCQPWGVALDGTGDLFIADRSNHRIRKVDSGGTITTVAGNAFCDFSGDGGPATIAKVCAIPLWCSAGRCGQSVYRGFCRIAEIRKVNSGGTITTVAGNGPFNFCGDGGAATGACLANPSWVVLDGAGDLFIADQGNSRIRKVNSGGTITTVGGNGVAGFCGDGGPATSACLRNPFGVALDGAGNLFIADQSNQRIRKVDSGGTITTVAGNGVCAFLGDGGPATIARLCNPAGVALDGAGNLFIADQSNNRIRKVDTSGTIITASAGGNGSFSFCGDGGPATSACLQKPFGVALDGAGNLFIADLNNNRIRKVDSSGTITTVAGNDLCGFSGDGGPATSATLCNPTGVALDGAGNLFIADLNNQRIRKVDSGGTITTVAGNGSFNFCGDGGPATSACLRNPTGVVLDGQGNLFIADRGNHRIRKVSHWRNNHHGGG